MIINIFISLYVTGSLMVLMYCLNLENKNRQNYTLLDILINIVAGLLLSVIWPILLVGSIFSVLKERRL